MSIDMGKVTVARRHYNPCPDAYLCLGRLNASPSIGDFVVGWHSRSKLLGNHLREPHRFLDEASAARHFLRVIREGELPASPTLYRDWQKQAVYKWEQTFCEPHGVRLDKAQGEAIIRKVSRDYGIAPPKLVMRPENSHSEFNSDSNQIAFGHRDSITLLHELGHAVTAPLHEGNDMAYHGPIFVWKAIELYHRYANIELNHLIISATQRDIIGDLRCPQIVMEAPETRFRGPRLPALKGP